MKKKVGNNMKKNKLFDKYLENIEKEKKEYEKKIERDKTYAERIISSKKNTLLVKEKDLKKIKNLGDMIRTDLFKVIEETSLIDTDKKRLFGHTYYDSVSDIAYSLSKKGLGTKGEDSSKPYLVARNDNGNGESIVIKGRTPLYSEFLIDYYEREISKEKIEISNMEDLLTALTK